MFSLEAAVDELQIQHVKILSINSFIKYSLLCSAHFISRSEVPETDETGWQNLLVLQRDLQRSRHKAAETRRPEVWRGQRGQCASRHFHAVGSKQNCKAFSFNLVSTRSSCTGTSPEPKSEELTDFRCVSGSEVGSAALHVGRVSFAHKINRAAAFVDKFALKT